MNEADLETSTECKGLIRPCREEEQGRTVLLAWSFSPATATAGKEGCLGT